MTLSKKEFNKHYNLAFVAYGQGKYQEATAILQKLDSEFPNNPQIYLLQAHIYYINEQYQLAHQDYMRVIGLTQGHIQEIELINCAKEGIERSLKFLTHRTGTLSSNHPESENINLDEFKDEFMQSNQRDAIIQQLIVTIQKQQTQIETIFEDIRKIQLENQFLRSQLNQLDSIELSEMQSPKIASQPIDTIILSSNYLSNPSPVAQNKKEIDTIISKFNNREINYFRQTRFRPVKSRFNSSNIVVNIHDRRMIWIESSKSEQATHLLFELEGKDWLIPNITVQNFDQILSQLAKTLEIFIFPLGKENVSVTNLLKPAQVKFVNHEVWEIIELGEFTQINTENQTPYIAIQHQNNQSNAELAILTYLKKHGDATYNQLRLSIECEEEILRQSLIKLDKEDYITVEISQDHNVIYKVG